MSDERSAVSRRAPESILLFLILAAALAARAWHLTAGVPHAVGIDEPQVVDRALRILRTGDWNPHLFDYPSLVIYLHAAVAIARFLWGALSGEWASLDAYRIEAVYAAGRFVAALIGAATVWLTYRLGVELGARRAALLGAAFLAVRPLHVRESHFILTDVPMTALTTLAVWLSVRAARLGSVGAYACAGAACGLAAAAKYNGGLALVAAVTAWLVSGRASPGRWRTAGALAAAAALGFVAGAPYTVLDMPAFLDGFAAQFSRFAGPPRGADPAWLIYLKHLSPAWGKWSVPAALAGIAILLSRRLTRWRWMPAIVFTLAYFYVLSSHGPVFGRYTLPVLPMIDLFAACAVVEIVRVAAGRIAALSKPPAQRAVLATVAALLLFGNARETVRWLDQQKRSDTRAIATDWLKRSAPKGTRLAVENNGPTYLDRAGFRVTGTELLTEHGLEWYRERADYLVVSAADLTRYDAYLGAGPTVFQIAPTPQRWGPPILIVRLTPSTFPSPVPPDPAASPRH
jgi:4-amino-4-deoxy-L-arabinose transferase-like glycosyltransferase